MATKTLSETKSRYGTTSATKCEATVDPSEIAGLITKVRDVFNTEKTMSREWRIAQLRAFGRMLDECEKEFCVAMKEDLNKSHFEGNVVELAIVRAEVDTALAHLDSWMKPVKKPNTALNAPCWSTTQRDPLGVVLVMGAWNYPVQLSLAPMVGAIAAGNCVVLKPGSYAVATSNCLAKLVKKYLDNDAIICLEGNRQVTTALLKEKFDKIIFTGSGFVGKIVARAAAEHLTPCVLELGGKSPCIVDKNVDLEHAADRLCWGSFMNSGQTCIRPDFLMVHADVADAFLAALRKAIVKMYSSEVKETEWFGRCINDVAYKRLAQLIEDSKKYVVHGGETDASQKFIEPTIFDFGTDMKAFTESSLMQDEIFGPLLPAVRYTNLEDVIQFVRKLPTGKPLALYAFTRDSAVAKAIKTRTTSGGMCINDTMMHVATHFLPFGGVGNSGMGSYHGKYSFDAFTHEKGVLEKSQFLDQLILFKPVLAARFPPYTTFKQLLIKVASVPIAETIVNLPIPALRLVAKLAFVFLCLRLLGFNIVRE